MSSFRRPPSDVDRMTSIKVDNLPYNTHSEDLKPLFEKFGDVGDIYMPTERESGRSRGFAYIRFYEKRDADDAMDELNGRQYDGRDLRISVDDGRARTAGFGGGNRSCYSCGKEGHMARDCPDGDGSGGGRGGGGGGGSRACYSCGKDGHMARDCPDDRRGRGGYGYNGGGHDGYKGRKEERRRSRSRSGRRDRSRSGSRGRRDRSRGDSRGRRDKSPKKERSRDKSPRRERSRDKSPRRERSGDKSPRREKSGGKSPRRERSSDKRRGSRSRS